MIRVSSIYGFVAGLMLAAAATACASQPGDAQPTSTATGLASAAPSSPAQSPTPEPADKNKVTVMVGGSLRAGQSVPVTIGNGLDRTIYTEDHKTDCSILVLQRKDSGAWSDVGSCKLERPTINVAVSAKDSRTVTLDPRGAGTYRVKFTYRYEKEAGVEDPSTAYSGEFTIG